MLERWLMVAMMAAGAAFVAWALRWTIQIVLQ